MKKIIIIGSGSSGLMAAAMFKRFYAGRIKVEVYYDSKKKNIGVGESTTPAFVDFLKRFLKVKSGSSLLLPLTLLYLFFGFF